LYLNAAKAVATEMIAGAAKVEGVAVTIADAVATAAVEVAEAEMVAVEMVEVEVLASERDVVVPTTSAPNAVSVQRHQPSQSQRSFAPSAPIAVPLWQLCQKSSVPSPSRCFAAVFRACARQ
jgi:hypothetical protein